MKTTFRTVTNKSFQLNVEPSTKIGEVKARIQAEHGDAYPAGATVLIYQGKVLKDDTSLEDAKVVEGGFLVVMVQKPKPAASKPVATPPSKVSAPTSGPAQTTAPSTAAAPAPASGTASASATAAAPASNTPSTTTPSSTTPPASAPAQGLPAPAATGQPGGYVDGASTLATGSALEQQITQITEMGFPRDQVTKAMRAAFNNADRAVEYLMTGIPAGVEQQSQPVAAPTRAPASGGATAATGVPTAAAGGGGAAQQPSQGPNAQPLDMFAPQRPGAAGGGGGEGGGALDFLRNQPRFETLRVLVQQSPALLNPLLQEIGRNDPQLMQLINNNQQEFMRMLSEPPPPGTDIAAALRNVGANLEEAGEQRGIPAEIQLTQEEAAAVERLQGMGFSRDLCLEAFLACDRNEELAANYLLENGMEDA